MVARSASTTQKDMTTGDGKRDTNFTKVVAMVTGIPSLLYLEEAIKLRAKFCDMITVASYTCVRVLF